MTTNDFIDDQVTVNARITQHEIRLGLPASEPLADIARANMILRGMELMPTPTRAAAHATPPVASVPPRAADTTPTVTGMQRTAQAFASCQPAAHPPDTVTRLGELHGVNLLAAYYARHRKPTPTA